MYNRYIGNTGKYYKVSDDHNSDAKTNLQASPQNAESLCKAPSYGTPSKKGSYSIMQRNPACSIKQLVDRFLPKGTETSDLLLILVLLLLYLEKEDEEILIILSVLIFTGFI